MNRKVEMLVVLVGLVGGSALAQMPAGGGMGGGVGGRNPSGPGQGEGMLENFFPPELVMQNQKAIGLTEEQQTALRAEMQKVMARFTDLQWQENAEREALTELLKEEHLDEQKVLAQHDKLVAIENEIKRLRLALMLKVKNTLTAEQEAKLRNLKREMAPPGSREFQGRVLKGQGQSQGQSRSLPPRDLPSFSTEQRGGMDQPAEIQ